MDGGNEARVFFRTQPKQPPSRRRLALTIFLTPTYNSDSSQVGYPIRVSLFRILPNPETGVDGVQAQA